MLPIPGYTRLNRVFFLITICLSLVLRSESDSRRYKRFIAWVILPLMYLVMVVLVQIRVDRLADQNREMLDFIPSKQTVLFLDFKRNDSPVFQNPYKYLFCDYHLSKGGCSPYTFAWYLASPIKYRNWILRYPTLIRPSDFNKFNHPFGYDCVVAIGSRDEIPDEIEAQLSSEPFEIHRFLSGIVAFTPR